MASCTASVQMGSQHQKWEVNIWFPLIAKKRFVTNTCWQREKSFFSNGLSLGTGYINHTPAQSPCPRVVGQHISNFLYFVKLLVVFGGIYCLFLLVFLFSFLWVCVVLFCFILFLWKRERYKAPWVGRWKGWKELGFGKMIKMCWKKNS